MRNNASCLAFTDHEFMLLVPRFLLKVSASYKKCLKSKTQVLKAVVESLAYSYCGMLLTSIIVDGFPF